VPEEAYAAQLELCDDVVAKAALMDARRNGAVLGHVDKRLFIEYLAKRFKTKSEHQIAMLSAVGEWDIFWLLIYLFCFICIKYI
jgi:hypothetical protein